MTAPSYTSVDVENVVVGSTMPQISQPVKTLRVDGKDVQIIFDLSLTNLIDDVSADVSYYGSALPGTSETATEWRIMKKTVSGTVTSYQWANGSAAFNVRWDQRASYSYS